MEPKEYKQKFIEAWGETLNEYKTVKHEASFNTCKLCSFRCRCCINDHFADEENILGCYGRRTQASHSKDQTGLETIRIVAFFELALLWMQTIPDEHWHEIGTNPVFEGIKDIDEYIWHQYN